MAAIARARGARPALTGLSVLAFLANDHTPYEPGPYREVVAAGVEYLLKIERDGGLRGSRAGGGANNGNMYDHGIATFALAEALMTGDRRIAGAAFRGCDFIVAAQHRRTGGWRYVPGESGDTSVFGWQVMALHSAEQLGYAIPPDCRSGMLKYIDIASTGRRRSLGGYQPGGGPSTAMTAELLFCRIMLGQDLDAAAEAEVSPTSPATCPTAVTPTSTAGTTARSRSSNSRTTRSAAGTTAPARRSSRCRPAAATTTACSTAASPGARRAAASSPPRSAGAHARGLLPLPPPARAEALKVKGRVQEGASAAPLRGAHRQTASSRTPSRIGCSRCGASSRISITCGATNGRLARPSLRAGSRFPRRRG